VGDEIESVALMRAWTHAHEEDEGDRLVFRPADYAFPPARGRDSFALGANQELARGGPGPDDRRTTQTGTWSLDGRQLILRVPGRPEERLEVVSVDPEKLIVRR
jgi:hypothetical protein